MFLRYCYSFAYCSKIHYDEDDYVALNLEGELEEEEEEEESLSGPEKRDDKRERYHRPRRKRKRRRRIVEPEVLEEEYVDPEELPPRARWTIMATACLLLAMSLLLVGVTLRMAPIIDDMGESFRSKMKNFIKITSKVCQKFQRLKRISLRIRGWRLIVVKPITESIIFLFVFYQLQI